MDIYKAAGIIIKDKKLLVSIENSKDFYIAPGGSLEADETPKEALIRELTEELGIKVDENNLEEFGHFHAQAAGEVENTVHMNVFVVKKWEGEPSPHAEVREILWVTSDLPKDIKVGSIFEHEVIPRLKEQNLID
jgi:8-oxo-dGTP pyrophosphatase MutT (NUDIX family)